MRKQYHFWPGDEGLDAWDVDLLVALSADLPVEVVPLDEINEIPGLPKETRAELRNRLTLSS